MAVETTVGFSTGFGDIVQGLEGLFGTSQEGSSETTAHSLTKQSSDEQITGKDTEYLDISQDAIDKIVSDLLSGPDGLAEIFAGEQNAGIYNSSTAAQAAGDLSAKIVGEIAKLRAKKISTTDQAKTAEQTQETDSTSKTETESGSDGLLGGLF